MEERNEVGESGRRECAAYFSLPFNIYNAIYGTKIILDAKQADNQACSEARGILCALWPDA